MGEGQWGGLQPDCCENIRNNLLLLGLIRYVPEVDGPSQYKCLPSGPFCD